MWAFYQAGLRFGRDRSAFCGSNAVDAVTSRKKPTWTSGGQAIMLPPLEFGRFRFPVALASGRRIESNGILVKGITMNQTPAAILVLAASVFSYVAHAASLGSQGQASVMLTLAAIAVGLWGMVSLFSASIREREKLIDSNARLEVFDRMLESEPVRGAETSRATHHASGIGGCTATCRSFPRTRISAECDLATLRKGPFRDSRGNASQSSATGNRDASRLEALSYNWLLSPNPTSELNDAPPLDLHFGCHPTDIVFGSIRQKLAAVLLACHVLVVAVGAVATATVYATQRSPVQQQFEQSRSDSSTIVR